MGYFIGYIVILVVVLAFLQFVRGHIPYFVRGFAIVMTEAFVLALHPIATPESLNYMIVIATSVAVLLYYIDKMHLDRMVVDKMRENAKEDKKAENDTDSAK